MNNNPARSNTTAPSRPNNPTTSNGTGQYIDTVNNNNKYQHQHSQSGSKQFMNFFAKAKK